MHGKTDGIESPRSNAVDIFLLNELVAVELKERVGVPVAYKGGNFIADRCWRVGETCRLEHVPFRDKPSPEPESTQKDFLTVPLNDFGSGRVEKSLRGKQR